MPAGTTDQAWEEYEGNCPYRNGRIRCPLLSLIDTLDKRWQRLRVMNWHEKLSGLKEDS